MSNTANERDMDKNGGGGNNDDDYHNYDDICPISIWGMLFTSLHLYFSLFLFNLT
jgi:hypothetical protein